jgi:hypothetical protein
MFEVSYTKEISFLPTEPLVGECGFVYHTTLSLVEVEYVYDQSKPVLAFGLMLPNLWDTEGKVQFCVVDKDWQFVNHNHNWTYLFR